ncbi:MAG TPA: response regulator transcription factor [Acidimicrobiia bacterium]|nr:response regulator transcription factor [Acidimicrobiia bacterium]
MSRILIAEDEAGIASFIVKGLTADGHTATVATDGNEALAAGRSGAFDLIVLDLGLPERDGLAVLKALRHEGIATPVIILTARDSVDDLVGGLDAGADDYIAKPFRFDELLARIRTRLREEHRPTATTLQHGDVVLDVATRRVERDGRAVELTAREFLLAETLLRHPGQVLSRQQLLSRVWGYDFDGGSNIVDVYVGYLRRKLGAGLIDTVRGVGYRLGEPDHR